MDFLSNLTNTSVGNFFKGAVGNIGSFFSGTASKASGFLGFGDSYQGPKIPKSKGADKATEYFGSYQEYAGRGARNMENYGSYQQYAMRTPSKSSTPGFDFFDKIKQTFMTKEGLKNLYQAGRERRKATMEAFPTAGKVDASGLGASSITPGFGFASQATNRNAYGANQAAQAAIQAALANIKIQNAMLAQIKATKPNINLTSVNNSINTRLSRRA